MPQQPPRCTCACATQTGSTGASSGPVRQPGGDLPLGSAAAFRELIERLQCGVILTKAGERPAFANAYARQILDGRDGLAVSDRGLETLRPQETRLLRDAISRAATGELTLCATISVPRRTAARALAVHIPVPRHPATVHEVTVLVSDPTIQPALDPARLCRLYGLTRSESALAVMLAQGRTLEEAAELSFTSIHTVRTHLKRILLKTETARQADLVRLILMAVTAVTLD